MQSINVNDRKEHIMIEIGKKYGLKKLKGWFENDSKEFTVMFFGYYEKLSKTNKKLKYFLV